MTGQSWFTVQIITDEDPPHGLVYEFQHHASSRDVAVVKATYRLLEAMPAFRVESITKVNVDELSAEGWYERPQDVPGWTFFGEPIPLEYHPQLGYRRKEES